MERLAPNTIRDMIPFAVLLGIARNRARARGRAARGRTTIVLETELIRDDGKLAAKVTQTQAFLAV